jgi:hypothetical protein
MNRVIAFALIFTLFVPLMNSYSQASQKENPLEGAPIEEQFNYTIEKSNRYEEFRVVRIAWLLKLKSNVADTLNQMQNQLAGNKKQLNLHQQSIDSLKVQIGRANVQLDKAVTEKNSLNFLGAQISKGSYQTTMWGLVLILAGALAVFILLFKRSHIVTAQTKIKNDELRKEFEDHRKRVLEREKVVARNHLNELNKLRGK